VGVAAEAGAVEGDTDRLRGRISIGIRRSRRPGLQQAQSRRASTTLSILEP